MGAAMACVVHGTDITNKFGTLFDTGQDAQGYCTATALPLRAGDAPSKPHQAGATSSCNTEKTSPRPVVAMLLQGQ